MCNVKRKKNCLSQLLVLHPWSKNLQSCRNAHREDSISFLASSKIHKSCVTCSHILNCVRLKMQFSLKMCFFSFIDVCRVSCWNKQSWKVFFLFFKLVFLEYSWGRKLLNLFVTLFFTKIKFGKVFTFKKCPNFSLREKSVRRTWSIIRCPEVLFTSTNHSSQKHIKYHFDN